MLRRVEHPRVRRVVQGWERDDPGQYLSKSYSGRGGNWRNRYVHAVLAGGKNGTCSGEHLVFFFELVSPGCGRNLVDPRVGRLPVVAWGQRVVVLSTALHMFTMCSTVRLVVGRLRVRLQCRGAAVGVGIATPPQHPLGSRFHTGIAACPLCGSPLQTPTAKPQRRQRRR